MSSPRAWMTDRRRTDQPPEKGRTTACGPPVLRGLGSPAENPPLDDRHPAGKRTSYHTTVAVASFFFASHVQSPIRQSNVLFDYGPPHIPPDEVAALRKMTGHGVAQRRDRQPSHFGMSVTLGWIGGCSDNRCREISLKWSPSRRVNRGQAPVIAQSKTYTLILLIQCTCPVSSRPP
jgi:hypothetical protein